MKHLISALYSVLLLFSDNNLIRGYGFTNYNNPPYKHLAPVQHLSHIGNGIASRCHSNSHVATTNTNGSEATQSHWTGTKWPQDRGNNWPVFADQEPQRASTQKFSHQQFGVAHWEGRSVHSLFLVHEISSCLPVGSKAFQIHEWPAKKRKRFAYNCLIGSQTWHDRNTTGCCCDYSPATIDEQPTKSLVDFHLRPTLISQSFVSLALREDPGTRPNQMRKTGWCSRWRSDWGDQGVLPKGN